MNTGTYRWNDRGIEGWMDGGRDGWIEGWRNREGVRKDNRLGESAVFMLV